MAVFFGLNDFIGNNFVLVTSTKAMIDNCDELTKDNHFNYRIYSKHQTINKFLLKILMRSVLFITLDNNYLT